MKLYIYIYYLYNILILYIYIVLKALSFKSLSWISGTTFAEFIQFGRNQKLRRPRILCVYIYIYKTKSLNKVLDSLDHNSLLVVLKNNFDN